MLRNITMICSFLGVGIVIVLFMASENNIQRNNAFIRRIPPHIVKQLKSIDLKFNSYYIAGMTDQTIYLGNSTAPLLITEISLRTYQLKTHQIVLDQMNLPFRSVRIEVKPPYFFVADGSIPILFRGYITDWQAKTLSKNTAYFSLWTVIDSTSFGIRALSSTNQEQILGKLYKNHSYKVKFSTNLLKKQVDGYFDVDGQLLWNTNLQRLIYVYYYRNEYIVFNSELQLDFKGNTIDTIQSVSLKIADLKKTNQKKLLGNPIVVNKMVTTNDEFLFINSERLGRYEPKDLLKKASIIDVYNLKNANYVFSFYAFGEIGAKGKSIKANNDLFVMIIGNLLYIYKLQNNYFHK
ncbi:hypothetical protein UMM65_16560 [Aureibaculum sp. 2210JD6-5]|uniref:hypothetical protein n=1 Tax=Aureibaculum sp. 2210JD6-5 TaxID=3103957 RepID=UPI002AAD9681|nr:hypothetical protein [Aureibaculum sp. 2210JD6-5]MDY7396860.1 hypothetical protein [Aureibaculum sp. 2210JD6-5]